MKAKTVLVFVGGMTVGVTGTIYMSRNALREAFIKWSVEKVSETMGDYKPKYGRTDYSRQKPSCSYDQFTDRAFKKRKEAESVLNNMHEYLIQYGQVSVADYYDFRGDTAKYSDFHYGWTDLSEAFVGELIGGGYTIKLGPAKRLDPK